MQMTYTFPCDIGDTVFCVSHGKVKEATVVTLEVNLLAPMIKVQFKHTGMFGDYYVSDFGKTIFDTLKESKKIKE